jgi:hypothetical protein
MMEEHIITPMLGNEVLFYHRYVDDCFAVVQKGQEQFICDQMSSFDPELTFTLDLPVNGFLPFLDTAIYLDENSKLQYKFYRKSVASTVLTNFEVAVTPRKYLNSTLAGEIFRRNYCNTTETELKKSLLDLQNQFISNTYPVSLVEEKIREISEKKFQCNPNRQKNADELQTNWDSKALIKLNFTSKRCQKIAKKFISKIKAYTPDFKVHFVWRNITLRNIISPKLKKSEPIGSRINCCYLFSCPCEFQTYIGETKKRLASRAQEHQQKSRNTAIYQHIKSCETYQKLSLEKIGPNPTPKNRFKLHEEFFSLIGSNLGNYHSRKLFEAIQIHLNMPKLNEQVKSYELSLI